MIRTAIALALLCVASPAFAHPSCLDAKQPTNVLEPTVPYEIYITTRAKVHKLCGYHRGRDYTACTYEADGFWAIVISDDISLDEYACVVHYEKSHLAPNFWGDPAIENPETMVMLKRLKEAAR